MPVMIPALETVFFTSLFPMSSTVHHTTIAEIRLLNEIGEFQKLYLRESHTMGLRVCLPGSLSLTPPDQGRAGSVIEEMRYILWGLCPGWSLPSQQGQLQRCWLLWQSESEAVSRSFASDSLGPQWTVARQAPPSKGFSRQEYWSGLPCPLAHAGAGGLVPTNDKGPFHLHPSDLSKSRGQVDIRSDIGEHEHSLQACPLELTFSSLCAWITWRGF